MTKPRPRSRNIVASGSDSAGTPRLQPASQAAAWVIEGLVAKPSFDSAHVWNGNRAACIHLDHPECGIGTDSGIGFDGATNGGSPIRLLGLVLDPAAERATGGRMDATVPIDLWVRGEDVVAVYEPRDPRSLRATAMWRRWPTESPAVAAWELVVSCQTSLLESDATVVVRSLVDAGELASPGATAVLARTARGPSVLVAAHPLDARRLTSSAASDGGSKDPAFTAIDCWLFPSVVEKGVLLRGRVLAAVGPRENDSRWSASLLERFAESPPPLTT